MRRIGKTHLAGTSAMKSLRRLFTEGKSLDQMGSPDLECYVSHSREVCRSLNPQPSSRFRRLPLRRTHSLSLSTLGIWPQSSTFPPLFLTIRLRSWSPVIHAQEYSHRRPEHAAGTHQAWLLYIRVFLLIVLLTVTIDIL